MVALGDVEPLLEEEIALHRRHVELLSAEERAITKFASDDVTARSGEREELLNRVDQIAKEREALVRSIAGEGVPLRKAIALFGTPEEKRRLLPRAEELVAAIESSREATKRGGTLAQFALNLVHGSISIFWSATQHEIPGYDPRGAQARKYQPAGDRLSGVIKEA